jgi:type VI secretion system secreted protein Hcp
MKTTQFPMRLVAASLILITGAWFVLKTTAQSHLPPAPVDPAVEMFLKINEFEGESQDSAHGGWIDVASFQYSVSRPAGRPATGEPREPANHQGLTITKGIDKATPLLYRHCSSGEPLDNVVLEINHTTPDGQIIQEYRLRNAVITSTQTAVGPNPGSRSLEKVRFSYESIEWTYVKIDPATGRVASAAAMRWDLSANEEP